ncbi:MAG: SDR family oxidoreductase [Deltaproteobacteria bacterium]|nr:SDR family oxidoreductase [Deltaproteobacteria bacterium]
MGGKIILITGATSGIGRHAALYLAGQGHRVFATGRRTDALRELEAEAGDLPIEALELDVNDDESIAAAAAKVAARTEGYGLDVLINNAGYGKFGPVALVDEAEMRGQFETNVFGLVKVTQAFLPAMRKRGSGRVINVSSMVGRVALVLQGVYCATKHAVEALSDCMRREVAGFGVRVILVEPGMIRSNFESTSGSDMSVYDDDPIYGPAVRRYAEEVNRMYRFAPGPRPISRTIARAVSARRPRARYVSPSYNAIVLFFMRILPTRLADAIFRKVAGL